MGAIDPIFARKQAKISSNSTSMSDNVCHENRRFNNHLQHSKSIVLPMKEPKKAEKQLLLSRIISVNSLASEVDRARDTIDESPVVKASNKEPVNKTLASKSNHHQKDDALNTLITPRSATNPEPPTKPRNNGSFHSRARKFLTLSANGLKPSASASCLNLEASSQAARSQEPEPGSPAASAGGGDIKTPVTSPTRASLTHEWKKLKTPNKCRECNLIVYFNGRECSFCGFIAHKKCVTVLVIKCSGQQVSNRTCGLLSTRNRKQKETSKSSDSIDLVQQQRQQQQQFGYLGNVRHLKIAARRSFQGDSSSNQSNQQQQQQPASPKSKVKGGLQPIFGQPVDVDGRHVVDFLRRFIYEIDTRGLTSKGIYRVSSIKSKVDRLCNYYDQNLSCLVDLSSFHPNIIANALKMYLRLLPEPLLTRRMYNKFIEIGKKYINSSKPTTRSHTAHRVAHIRSNTISTLNSDYSLASNPAYNPLLIVELREIIEQLPQINQKLVAILMRHLKKVSDMSDENQMTAKNLSIIFGPTLLSDTSDSLSIVDNIHQARVIELMIIWADQIFPQYANYETKALIELDLPSWYEFGKNSEEDLKLMSAEDMVLFNGYEQQLMANNGIDNHSYAASQRGNPQNHEQQRIKDNSSPTAQLNPVSSTRRGSSGLNQIEFNILPTNAKTRQDLHELRRQFFNESHSPKTEQQPEKINPRTKTITDSSSTDARRHSGADVRKRSVHSPTGSIPKIKIQPYCTPKGTERKQSNSGGK